MMQNIMKMELKPRIECLREKQLIGFSVMTNVSENKTSELWQKFLSREAEIENRVSHDLISMQIYNKSYFRDYTPEKEFEKWACVEVDTLEKIPKGMSSHILNEGGYAVFDYKGLSTDFSIFQYIYGEWLPNSDYQLGARPHFEVLGEKYRNNDPDSEEQIWIPVTTTTDGEHT